LSEEADATPADGAEGSPADPVAEPSADPPGQAAKDAKPGGSDGPARHGELGSTVPARHVPVRPAPSLSASPNGVQKSHCRSL